MGLFFSLMLALVTGASAESKMVLEWGPGGAPSTAAYANPSETILKVHPSSGPLFHYLNALDPNARQLFDNANCFKLKENHGVNDAWNEHHQIVEVYSKGCNERLTRNDLVTTLRVRNNQLFAMPREGLAREKHVGSISATLGGDYLNDLCANHLNTKSLCAVDFDGVYHIQKIRH